VSTQLGLTDLVDGRTSKSQPICISISILVVKHGAHKVHQA